MRLSFRKRILGYFLLICIIYTVGIIYFEQKHEKEQLTNAMQTTLDNYAELVNNYIVLHNIALDDSSKLRDIVNALPKEMRVTIINSEGKVVFDKDVKYYNQLTNHLDRVEIKTAQYQTIGTNIRKSESTNQEHLYYAKHYSNYFIRVALPYNIETKNLLKPDNHFIITTLALFTFILMLLYLATGRFNKSIQNLKYLTRSVKNHEPLTENIELTNDELGDISKELVSILDQKDKTKHAIKLEREKLRQHFQYSEEGLAIFDSNFKRQYMNTLFVQFVNMLTKEPTLQMERIFDDETFAEIIHFINNRDPESNNFACKVEKNGKAFSLKVIIFEDNSFEITIIDITKLEKTRKLKQEMTSNIAHELRTPVTALRGYLETMHEQKLDADKQNLFVEKAHLQSIRLSNLIEDVSLLSKIEEQDGSYSFDSVNMSRLVDAVRIASVDKLLANGTTLISTIKSDVMVKGNRNLLFSTIQNLVDNSLNYAGKGVDIFIDCYMEDNNFSYFSFHDTGIGVDENHMNKLFERFYRIDEGRDRNTGGSGLGLSIVKNTILLHKGNIQVKKHSSGGLQFLFSLQKDDMLL